MTSARYAFIALILAACGGGSTPASRAENIEAYCRAQAMPRGAAFTPDTSACPHGVFPESSNNPQAFCQCRTAADCPGTGLVCDMSQTSPGICVPADSCVSYLRAVPVAQCVAQTETNANAATAAGCGSQFDEVIACIAARGPTCNPDDLDSLCGGELGRFDACRQSNPSDAGTSSDAGADAQVDAPSN